jgi:hypothetical protein
LSVPEEVTVYNTPVTSRDRLNADIGIFVQDSWRLKRLTMNAGLRWEHVNAQTEAWSAPEGRFVPRREVAAVKNLPDWYDWAPRFSVVYDLFGDSRTAIKYAANRYNRSAATALANTFNVLTEDDEDLPWEDLNGDDIAQGGRTFIYNANGTVTPVDCVFRTPGCEIDLSGLDPTSGVFGTPSAQTTYQGFPRVWNFEQLVEVQHALTRRLSITGSWTRGSDRDITKTVNSARLEGDYLPYKNFSPIDGTPITLWYPKDAATRTRLRTANVNRSYVEPFERDVYQQWSLEYRMRPYAGAQIFGGFTMDRNYDFTCTTSVPGFVVDPNSLRFCDDNTQAGIDDGGVFEQAVGLSDQGGSTPWAKDFRLGVSLPLPWYGVTLGLSYLNNDSGNIVPTYSIIPGSGATGTRYPDGGTAPTNASFTRKIANQPAPPCPTAFGCVPGAFVIPSACTTTCSPGQYVNPGAAATSTVTINMYPSGRIRRERLNQVDLKLSKTFRVRNVSILPTLEAYNLFNKDTIFGYASGTFATSGGNYLVPSATLQSRIIGFGAQGRW